MRKTQSVFDNTYVYISVSILAGIIFVLLDSIGLVTSLRNGISYVFEPLAYNGAEIGTGVRRYFQNFVKMGEFMEDYNNLKIDMYEKDINNSYYLILKEENDSLKKQLNLSDISKKYVTCKVLGRNDSEYIKINAGSDDGVKQDNVVSIGNVYVGQVIKSDKTGSLVKLPLSKGNNFEAIITQPGVENAVISSEPPILSKAVVIGTGNGIKVENMSADANVKEGDVVVLNDEKIGNYLVLGYLVGLSDNPANTSKTGYVNPLINYDNLITVFVEI
ncbi:MAG TPA: rod shape-determining protein MreC [Candidatus Dojkabacteria bacterium]|jgi:rod shape-determining protein MreC|nr:rod shape-determining protein MreC [Candidatus Dojkabacteria bacterium]